MVDKKWFDPNTSIMQRIEQSLGVPTATSAVIEAPGLPAPTATQGESLVVSLPGAQLRHEFLLIIVVLPIAALV